MNDNMKFSNFNIVLKGPFSNKNYIYNSLAGIQSLRIITEEELDKYYNCKINELDYYFKKYLIQYGMILDESINEETKYNLKKNSFLTNSSLTIVTMPTEDCNFRCSYCYQENNLGAMKPETIDGIINYIRKNIFKFTSIHINWFGGEPLLAIKKIEKVSFEIKKICKNTCRPFSANIITNGYLLNTENMKRLIKCGVTSFQITLDGDEISHNKSRFLYGGKSTYNEIIKNLIDIKESIKNRGIRIIIRVNFLNSMLQNTQNIIKNIDQLFGKDNRFSMYFRPVGNWGGNRVKKINKDELLEGEKFKKVYSAVYNLRPRIKFTLFEDLLFSPLCTSAKINDFVIGADGTIYKCTCHFDLEINKVGKLLSNGDLEYNQNIYLWFNFEEFNNCSQCSNRGDCMTMTCPFNYHFNYLQMIKSECYYEKKYVSCTLDILNLDNHIRNIERGDD